MKLTKVILIYLFLSGLCLDIKAQCGAAYMSSDDTVVCVPKIVKFTVNNFPAGTTFEWDLGSGYVSSDENYTKLYSAPGNYNVRVKLKYLDGSTCIMDYNSFIIAKAIPIPQYSISRNVICKYNDSFIVTDNSPKTVRRDWLVDATLYANGPKNLKAIFHKPAGFKSLTIFMVDSFGCEGKRTFDSVAYVSDSISVNFDANTFSGCIPKAIHFINLTDTLNQPIATWNWSFPGGAIPATSNQFEPHNIIYNLKDTFDVQLSVTTKKGCSYSHIENNFLTFADSIAISASFSKTILCANEYLTVNLLNTRSDTPYISVTPTFHTEELISTTKRIYKFTNFGTFSVYLSDETNGCKSEKYYNNHIQVNGPIARIHIPFPSSCLRPDTLKAFDSSYLHSSISRTLRWDLYYDTDLNTSIQTGTSQPMNFICTQFRNYAVRLIVSGSNGCKDTLLKMNALQIKPIEPDFSWFPRPACPAEMVDFSNGTPRGTSKVANRYRWTFYKLDNSVLHKDTVVNPRLSYPDTGKYSVKLLVFNNLGCRDSITYTNKIVISKPTPKFIVYDSSVCFGKSLRLKATYLDSNFYIDYIHKWLFQHKDSANLKFSYTGDSINASLFPGEYIISYSRYSKRQTCFDTFTLTNRVRVSGARYLPSVNPPKVCNPFTVTLDAKLTYNYNYINNSIDPITHTWSHSYDTNRVAIRQKSINPSYGFVKKSGLFFFKFNYIHPSGCSDSVYTTTLTSGVVSQFFTGSYACVNKKAALANRSDKDAIGFKWFMRDSGSGASFLPSNTDKEPSILFKNEGIFRVGLIAYGSGNCTDTSYVTIYVNNIRASFTSTDTLNYCAPVIARIVAQRHSAIYQYKWYMGNGDSITNNLSTIAHLYKQNTGPDGSDVKLVVMAYGCNDTLDRKGYIKVIGPIPKFTLTNNVGCETLKVNFINESKYYKRFFLEYGDGSTLDSINFNFHNYQIYDRSLPTQKFKPVLSVIDSFGCFVQFQRDSILVLRAPESKFNVNRDTGCAALEVTFTNLTIGGVSSKWDFDGNGTIDNVTFAPKFFYGPGEFNPRLISKGTNGCEDTAKDIVFIKAYTPPNARFTTNVDTVCYNGAIQFTASNLPQDSDIKKWAWDFGDYTTFRDTALVQNPTFNFKKIFLSQVVLQVTDKNNCTDTFDKFIYVNDTIGPVSSPMHYVTVTNNKDISVSWGKSNFKKFDSYNLFNDNSNVYTLLYNTTSRNDTNFKVLNTTGVNVQTSRYCYVIKTKDKCNNLGIVTFPHCTIFLEINDDSINDLYLNWLPYEGWEAGNVLKYRIYRSENGGPFKLHDSTSNSTLTYKDKKLCTKAYCYYVVAVQKNGPWVSQSNTVCKTPKYFPPTIPVSSIRTTVLPNGKTYTQWDANTHVKNVDHYIISRAYNGAGSASNYSNVDSLGFIDDDPFLNTDQLSYTYKIRVADHCNIESPESVENKTILLKGNSGGYVAKLNWTDYRKWYSGVKQYEVLIRDNNTFKIAGTVDSSNRLFEFDFMDTKLDDSICFKIRAIKDTNILVESFSNMLCLIADAQVWVPNAFSPNGDGKNDVFIPKAILIFNQTGNPILDYKLEIYNRWGEQVFESYDVSMGWDGTYKGEMCMEGHYVFKVRALALDGVTAFNLEGVIVLLR